MKEITAYQCEFCEKKIYRHKSSALRHEKKCFANPANKACRSCKHLVKDSETVYVPPRNGNYGDDDYDIEYFACEIKDIAILHPEKQHQLVSNCPYYKQGEVHF